MATVTPAIPQVGTGTPPNQESYARSASRPTNRSPANTPWNVRPGWSSDGRFGGRRARHPEGLEAQRAGGLGVGGLERSDGELVGRHALHHFPSAESALQVYPQAHERSCSGQALLPAVPGGLGHRAGGGRPPRRHRVRRGVRRRPLDRLRGSRSATCWPAAARPASTASTRTVAAPLREAEERAGARVGRRGDGRVPGSPRRRDREQRRAAPGDRPGDPHPPPAGADHRATTT